MTIKIKFALLRGVGLEGREEKRPKTLLFFSWETPRQYNFESANFIVEKFCCHCAGSYFRAFSSHPLQKNRKLKNGASEMIFRAGTTSAQIAEMGSVKNSFFEGHEVV